MKNRIHSRLVSFASRMTAEDIPYHVRDDWAELANYISDELSMEGKDSVSLNEMAQELDDWADEGGREADRVKDVEDRADEILLSEKRARLELN